MDFQQSKTFINLQSAFENELSTISLYEMFSKRANQEVYVEISYVFDTIARNGKFIGERLRRIIYSGDTSTEQNLLEASENAYYATNTIYKEYSRIASEEGYNDLASLFNGIANIKRNHNLTLQALVTDMQNNELFCKPREALWICLGCGNIISGICAPEICPICGYPQGYYKLEEYY